MSFWVLEFVRGDTGRGQPTEYAATTPEKRDQLIEQWLADRGMTKRSYISKCLRVVRYQRRSTK